MKEIIVNGVRYDAQTGQPLDVSAEDLVRENIDSGAIHQTAQKSKTLNRRYVKAPEITPAGMIQQFKRRHDEAEFSKLHNAFDNSSRQAVSGEIVARKRAAVVKPSSRSVKSVVRASKNTSNQEEKQLEAYKMHPLQRRAYEQMRARREERVLPSMSEIKHNAIASALNKMSKDSVESKTAQKTKKIWRWVLSGVVAVALIVAAAVLANLPQISTSVASARSGFSATIPQWVPQHYKMSGVPYRDDRAVVMKFSKAGTNLEIRQSESAWSSVGLLENYVSPKYDKNYTTYKERGITFYRSGNAVVWVNGGRLFELTSDENLVGEELILLAASF